MNLALSIVNIGEKEKEITLTIDFIIQYHDTFNTN
jgi:hypothetical protein